MWNPECNSFKRQQRLREDEDDDGDSAKAEVLPIKDSSDVVFVRQRVRVWAMELKFSLVDQTKIVTAASELGRNTLEHGGGGESK